ncbi:MAG TPA: HEAT repeat domain-containing protein [Gemmataceae bacterium]|nr:HEAT repeat domain-containing protein [Gemmataceae bacterium]
MQLHRLALLAAAWALGASGGAAPLPTPAAADEAILKAAHIGTDDASLLRYFRERSAVRASEAQIDRWIEELGDDSFFVREKASAKLAALGNAAAPALRRALDSDDPEVVHRARKGLAAIQDLSSTRVPCAAAHILRQRRPAGTAMVLLNYLPSASSELVLSEVRRTLAALAVRNGQPNSHLVEALTDASAQRRAAAAVALCEGGASAALPAVHGLLKDPDPAVRRDVALALVQRGERAAVPVLIDTLAQAAPPDARRTEEVLFRLGEDDSPDVGIGEDAQSRQASREAWAAWWKKHSAGIDLGKLHRPPQKLGYTMVVLLDGNAIMELDRDGQTSRWRMSGLEMPLDAQKLPGPRVLVAEQRGNRVTERSTVNGAIRWEYSIPRPLVAQRLKNGHTFIATGNQISGRVVEIDRGGNEVFSRDFDTALLRAVKLPDGGFACVFSNATSGRYVRFDADGKESQSFPVEIHTAGGRIDVMPNGHVLVPEVHGNRVVEYTATGKEVWQTTFDQPVAAIRLPNGHTLVTSMSADIGAVELDKAGKHVWQYKSESRVTRAWRR